ncbi:hypothetical protein WA158_004589 [Blastocystis sp. Blastoise]
MDKDQDKATSNDTGNGIERNYHFPFDPYPSQKMFMDTAYDILAKGKVGILESPTGTGKSLCVLCSALTWLKDAPRLPDDLKRKDPSVPSNVPKWLADVENDSSETYTKRLLLSHQLGELDQRINEIHKNGLIFPLEKRRKIESKSEKKNKKEEEEDSDIILSDYDDNSSSSPSPSKIISYEEEEDRIDNIIYTTKIYICSRTHSQLQQLYNEFKRTDYYPSVKSIILGSRKVYCINNQIRSNDNDQYIQEKCLQMQRATKKEGKCPFKETEKCKRFADFILSDNFSVEELYFEGCSCSTCPYYSVRDALPNADLVFLPYNLILSKESRDSYGIDLHNSVIIFDEAHNVIDSLNDIYSPSLERYHVDSSLFQLQNYLDRYKLRLRGRNIFYIQQLLMILNKLLLLFDKIEKKELSKPVYSVSDILILLELEDINIYSINTYIKKANLFRKLNGFCDRLEQKQEKEKENEVKCEKQSMTTNKVDSRYYRSYFPTVFQFILSLKNSDNNGRICIYTPSSSTDITSVSIKYINLNPASYFKEIEEQAWSILFTGGTLKPISDLTCSLFPAKDPATITTLSLPHIVPPKQFKPIIITSGPSGKEFEFSFKNRGNTEMYLDSINVLRSLFTITPGGIVLFFPSFQSLSDYIQLLKTHNFYDVLHKKKEIFVEPRGTKECDDILVKYTESVHSTKNAALFSVVGGKLSEGINFSDELARCVIMMGVPFPNVYDIIIKEKMNYLNQHPYQLSSNTIISKQSTGQQYYINLCMKATNQSVGRALRHKDDWAAIVFLDKRFKQTYLISLLPDWINKNITVSTDYKVAFNSLKEYIHII